MVYTVLYCTVICFCELFFTQECLYNNLLDCSVEHYYCVTVFLPYVDCYLMQLSERFMNHKAIFEGKYIICIYYYIRYYMYYI